MSLTDSSCPLLNLFRTMFIFSLWVIWIWIWVFIDIFRSDELSGGGKALWFVFVLFIPVIGGLVYLIAWHQVAAWASMSGSAGKSRTGRADAMQELERLSGAGQRRAAGMAARACRPW